MKNKIRRATIMGFHVAVAIASGGCQFQPAGTPCGDGLCPEGKLCVQPSNTELLGTQKICVTPEACGNGFIDVDRDEECDDGLQNSETGHCRPDCRLNKCGDGHVDPPYEECDDGPGNGNDKDCRSDCVINRCGDGYVDTKGAHLEGCDGAQPAAEGSRMAMPVETPDCNLDCTIRICGDGKVNQAAGEDCDDGKAGVPENSDRCNSDCTFARCGDGQKNPEFKPDGVNTEFCDEVDPTTHASLNGVPCDYGNPFCVRCNAMCTGNVSPGGPFCGDGITQTDFHEQCDPATGPSASGPGDPPSELANADSATCDNDCTPVVCGDGYVNKVAGESCDDGNQNVCGTCPATDCKKALPITATQASATVTTSAGAQIGDAGDFIKLDDGFGNVITFEYTTGSTSIANAFPIMFDKSVDGAVTIASNTASAIHARFMAGFGGGLGSGFSIDASVPPNGTTVTLTNQHKSRFGNKAIVTNGLPQFGFSPIINGVFTMNGGAAGDCGPDIGCLGGDDCASGMCNANHKCQ